MSMKVENNSTENRSNEMEVTTFSKHDRVRPSADGESRNGSRIRNTEARGEVLNAWFEGTQERVEVEWFRSGGIFVKYCVCDAELLEHCPQVTI